MSPSDALYRAVCAAPHDDLPRLVYADWLEENGRGERAEFIRVQCRLANASPADADYVDLFEREAELKAILWRELDADRPPLPFGISWEPEHRGFAERLRLGNMHGMTGTAELLEGLSAGVPIGGLRFEFISLERFRQFAGHDFHTTVTSLEFPYTHAVLSDLVEPIESERFPNLRRLVARGADDLVLFGALVSGPVRELTELHMHALHLSGAVPRFPSAGSLRSLILGGGLSQIGSPLPELHTLVLGRFSPADAGLLADLPKLLSLSTSTGDWVPLLAKRNRPLAELRAVFGSALMPLVALFRKEWVSELRVFEPAGIPDSVRAALQSRRMTGLRQLWLKGLNDRSLRPEDLLEGRWWGSLTTLEVPPRLFPQQDDGRAFLSRLVAPRLKHINLKGVPLGDAGAVALAENASLAKLTRLNLSACRIGPRGVGALLNSPHLQRLIELNLYANNGGEAVAPLADAGVMPNLGLVDVAANGVSDELRSRLEQRPAIRAR